MKILFVHYDFTVWGGAYLRGLREGLSAAKAKWVLHQTQMDYHEIISAVNKEDPDAVLFGMPWIPVQALAKLRESGRTLFAHVHNWTGNPWACEWGMQHDTSDVDVFSYYDGLFVNLPSVAASVRSWFDLSRPVIASGFPVPGMPGECVKSWSGPQQPLRVVVSGRLEQDKQWWLPAAALYNDIVSGHVHLTYLHPGPVPTSAPTPGWLRALQGRGVEVQRKDEYSEYRAALRTHHVLVNASLQETLGVTLMEAAAEGVYPVLSDSPWNVAKDLFGTGHTYSAFDLSEMRERVMLSQEREMQFFGSEWALPDQVIRAYEKGIEEAL